MPKTETETYGTCEGCTAELTRKGVRFCSVACERRVKARKAMGLPL